MSALAHTVVSDTTDYDRHPAAPGSSQCLEERFSTRENQVLHLLIAGFTGREIGICLNLCPRTVEMYRVLINYKLDEPDSF